MFKITHQSDIKITRFFEEKEGYTSAQVLRCFPIGELPALVNNYVGLQNSAIDDIPLSMPAGSAMPSKTQSSSFRYQRDDKLRLLRIDGRRIG
jgi:hypothetical protein